MAFATARKAEAYGVEATAGKVLGIVGFVLGLLFSIAYFLIR
ncbi:hypothetical protein [Paenarthrobacter nitroguajacolicus]|nr:hypothetical protein [Paenarthrobacter nitroguajacolicus]MDR6640624.1 hypothetical protein [Paenarthrobacter nitroguajacolicus]